MIRVGIAGVGGLGQLHLGNYLGIPDVQVAALADPEPKRRSRRIEAAEVNLRSGSQDIAVGEVRSFADYGDLCRADGIDAISVCLPTDLHADATVLALECGKHVFCEKPMALSVADGRRMLDAAASAGRVLMIGHVLRFWPAYVEMEKAIRAGSYGRVLAAQFWRFGSTPMGHNGWFRDARRSGGAAVDLHIHDVDTCLWWWGRPHRRIAGGACRPGEPNIVHGEWRYRGGPSVQMLGLWDAGSPFNFTARLVFETATLVYDFVADTLTLAGAQGTRTVPCERGLDAYMLEDKYFFECVRGGKEPVRCRPADSLTALDYALQTAADLMAPQG